MTDQQIMQQLRGQIADTVTQRDALKLAIEQQKVPTRQGLRELEELDVRLSTLDTQFKTLWDSAQAKAKSA